MLKAYDKVLARDVTAREAAKRSALGDRGSRYRCLGVNCRADVTIRRLRDGPIFAHMPGKAARNCDQYHEGIGGAEYSELRSTVRLNEVEQLKRPGLELSVDVTLRSWRLTYFLPCHKLRSQFFPISVAPGSQPKKISVDVLSRQNLRFDVVPSGEPIGFAGQQFDESWDSEYFRPATFVLNSNGLTAFHAAGVGYHRAVGSELFWGTTYFVIWNLAANVNLPERLLPIYLQDALGWRCAIITLPAKPAESIQQYLESVTNLGISSKKAEIRVLYPQGVDTDPRGEILLPRSDQILLSISRSTAEALVDAIIIEGQHETAVLDVDDQAATFIMLRPLSSEEHFFIRYHTEPAFLLHVSSTFREQRSGRLLLEVTDFNGRSKRVNFFSLQAHKLLAQCRRGKQKEASLLTDTTFEGVVSRRELDGWKHDKVLHIQDHDGLVSVAEVDLHQLLRSSDRELFLDFGGFGKQHVPAQVKKRTKRQIDARIVERFQWIVGMAAFYDVETETACRRLHLGDDSAAFDLLTQRDVPRHLHVHLRSLLAEFRLR